MQAARAAVRLATREEMTWCFARQQEWHPAWLPIEPLPLIFPTIVALRQGEIIGFLGTMTPHDIITAGPLVFRPGIQGKGFLLSRMWQLYEQTFRTIGILQYHFFVETSNTEWLQQVYRIGFQAVAYAEEGYQWFVRHIPREAPQGRVVQVGEKELSLNYAG